MSNYTNSYPTKINNKGKYKKNRITNLMKIEIHTLINIEFLLKEYKFIVIVQNKNPNNLLLEKANKFKSFYTQALFSRKSFKF